MRSMLYILGFLVSLLMAFIVFFGLIIAFETSGINTRDMTKNQKGGCFYVLA